ncbi:MAG: FIST C-terminal domain-containing protein [Elusimicrobia bacterium]|nr:FIST C-terminal domain-containing protein [Elusimicrobiota bacterium]
MSISVAVCQGSNLKNPLQCGGDLAREALRQFSPRCLLAFSPYHGVDHRKLLRGIRMEAGDCPLVGGTTYGGISGAVLTEASIVLMALGGDIQAAAGYAGGLAKDSFEAGRQAAQMALSRLGGPKPKLFILMHEPQMGIPVKILEGAQSVLGAGFPIIGGGTGTGVIMEQSPMSIQFMGDKALAGCCVGLLLAGDFEFSCGFSHGGTPISRPFTLTKTRGNILVELDHRPALDVMEEAFNVQYHPVDIPFSNYNLACSLMEEGTEDFTLFGIWGANAQERTLYCGTPIIEGAKYRFVTVEPDSLLNQTREGVLKALKSLKADKVKGTLCFDCYGRKLQLGAHGLIDQELKIIHELLGKNPLAGMYSGSEIDFLNSQPMRSFSRYGHASTSFAVFADP